MTTGNFASILSSILVTLPRDLSASALQEANKAYKLGERYIIILNKKWSYHLSSNVLAERIAQRRDEENER